MDKLERDIKNRLAQSETMKGIDSGSLWASISEASGAEKTPKNKKRFGFWWLLLPMLFVGGVLAYLPFRADKADGSSPLLRKVSAPFIELKPADKKEEFGSNEKMDVTPASIADSSKFTSTRSDQKSIDQPSPIAQNDAPNSPLELSRQQISNTEVADANLSSNETDISETDISIDQSQTTSSGGHHLQPGDAEFETISKANTNISSFAPVLQLQGSAHKIFPLGAEQLPLSIYPTLKLKQQAQQPQSFKTPMSFKFYAGLVLLNHRFSEGTAGFADSLSNSMSSEYGYALGGLVRLKQGTNWYLRSGLEYARWNDRFDKVLLSDTTVTLDQQDVVGQNIRTVRHYNTMSMLSIPVQVGVFKDIKRFRFGVDAGVSYAFVLGQSGRILAVDESISEYSQSDKRFSNFFTFRVAPNIGWKLNERIILDASGMLSYQDHGTNSLNSLRSSTVAFVPTIGLTFNY